jgi:hypothetical protein
MMKTFIWILTIIGLCALALWIVMGPAVFEGKPVAILAGLFFLLPSLGVFWMLFVVVRHEPEPLPYVVLAFIPFVFLWYYFERYRRAPAHHTWK